MIIFQKQKSFIFSDQTDLPAVHGPYVGLGFLLNENTIKSSRSSWNIHENNTKSALTLSER